ncbi:MAG: hypothetical protein G01um101425_932 [Candidatus Peregrinibacteria bacterium Gr01-1014_25]|nr:MAG: hypothetical protein G01um101425_932 [Candidatus Peregrinibacteria bacterium Gr01-1014_25]
MNSRSRRLLQVTTLGLVTVGVAFAMGLRTSESVRTIASIEAGTALGDGDFDGNGVMDIADAIRALEIVHGYATPTPNDLRADPNGDGIVTIDDALHILQTLAGR